MSDFRAEKDAVEKIRYMRKEARRRARTSHGQQRSDLEAAEAATDEAGHPGGEYRDVINLLGHTNYPAMVELFMGSGVPPPGTNTDVNVSFELFEQVQKRALAAKEELETLRGEMVKCNQRNLHLATENTVLSDRLNSLERQLSESDAYCKQLRELSLDAAMNRDQQEAIISKYKDETAAAVAKAETIQEQLNSALFKASDAQVLLAQRDSLIANLRRERDDAVKRIRSRNSSIVGFSGDEGDAADGVEGKNESSVALRRLRSAVQQVHVGAQLQQARLSLVQTEEARKELEGEVLDLKASVAAIRRHSRVVLSRWESRCMALHDLLSGGRDNFTAAAEPPPATKGDDHHAPRGESTLTPGILLENLMKNLDALTNFNISSHSNFCSEMDTFRDSAFSLARVGVETMRLLARFDGYLRNAISLGEIKESWERIEQKWYSNINSFGAQGVAMIQQAMTKLSSREDRVREDVQRACNEQWQQTIREDYIERAAHADAIVITESVPVTDVGGQVGSSFISGRGDKCVSTLVIRGSLKDIERGTWTDVDYKIPDWVERLPVPPADLQERPRRLFDDFPKRLLAFHVRVVELAVAMRKKLKVDFAVADPATFLSRLSAIPTIVDAYEIVNFDEELIQALLSSVLLSKADAAVRLLQYKKKADHFQMERTLEVQAESGKKLGFVDRQQVADFKSRRKTIERDIETEKDGDAAHKAALKQALEEHVYAGAVPASLAAAAAVDTSPQARRARASVVRRTSGAGAPRATRRQSSVPSSVAGEEDLPLGAFSGPQWTDLKEDLKSSTNIMSDHRRTPVDESGSSCPLPRTPHTPVGPFSESGSDSAAAATASCPHDIAGFGRPASRLGGAATPGASRKPLVEKSPMAPYIPMKNLPTPFSVDNPVFAVVREYPAHEALSNTSSAASLVATRSPKLPIASDSYRHSVSPLATPEPSPLPGDERRGSKRSSIAGLTGAHLRAENGGTATLSVIVGAEGERSARIKAVSISTPMEQRLESQQHAASPAETLKVTPAPTSEEKAPIGRVVPKQPTSSFAPATQSARSRKEPKPNNGTLGGNAIPGTAVKSSSMDQTHDAPLLTTTQPTGDFSTDVVSPVTVRKGKSWQNDGTHRGESPSSQGLSLRASAAILPVRGAIPAVPLASASHVADNPTGLGNLHPSAKPFLITTERTTFTPQSAFLVLREDTTTTESMTIDAARPKGLVTPANMPSILPPPVNLEPLHMGCEPTPDHGKSPLPVPHSASNTPATQTTAIVAPPSAIAEPEPLTLHGSACSQQAIKQLLQHPASFLNLVGGSPKGNPSSERLPHFAAPLSARTTPVGARKPRGAAAAALPSVVRTESRADAEPPESASLKPAIRVASSPSLHLPSPPVSARLSQGVDLPCISGVRAFTPVAPFDTKPKCPPGGFVDRTSSGPRPAAPIAPLFFGSAPAQAAAPPRVGPSSQQHALAVAKLETPWVDDGDNDDSGFGVRIVPLHVRSLRKV